FRFDPYDPSSVYRVTFGLFVSPAYLLTIALGFLCYGAGVVFAYLDWRELARRGVPRPFHWAFQFIPYWVYPIGRAVVVSRRTGGTGMAVLWATIASIVLLFVFSIVLTFVAIAAVFSALPPSLR